VAGSGRDGGAENARPENARHEIAGHENAGQCEMQNVYSSLQTWSYYVGSNEETVAQKWMFYFYRSIS